MYPTEIPAGSKTVETHEGWTLNYSVDITAPFAINAWNVTSPYPSGEPFWHQPLNPEGGNWSDEVTAQAFADKWINDNFVTSPAPVTSPSLSGE